MAEYECDIFADVDFGRGPVEIRCTQKGPHAQHRCEVFIKSSNLPQPDPSSVQRRHNVFERSAE